VGAAPTSSLAWQSTIEETWCCHQRRAAAATAAATAAGNTGSSRGSNSGRWMIPKHHGINKSWRFVARHAKENPQGTPTPSASRPAAAVRSCSVLLCTPAAWLECGAPPQGVVMAGQVAGCGVCAAALLTHAHRRPCPPPAAAAAGGGRRREPAGNVPWLCTLVGKWKTLAQYLLRCRDGAGCGQLPQVGTQHACVHPLAPAVGCRVQQAPRVVVRLL
jgi:hypothetical protein